MKKLITLFAVCIFSMLTAEAQDASTLFKKGTAAPDFTITSIDGKQVKLSDYKEKYVVLDFWASWCSDCRRETPALKELYKSMKDKGVVFLGISFDTDEKAWKDYVAKEELPWIHASELKKWKETEINGKYNLGWIPTFYIVDKKGNIVSGSFTVEQLSADLAGEIK